MNIETLLLNLGKDLLSAREPLLEYREVSKASTAAPSVGIGAVRLDWHA